MAHLSNLGCRGEGDMIISLLEQSCKCSNSKLISFAYAAEKQQRNENSNATRFMQGNINQPWFVLLKPTQKYNEDAMNS